MVFTRIVRGLTIIGALSAGIAHADSLACGSLQVVCSQKIDPKRASGIDLMPTVPQLNLNLLAHTNLLQGPVGGSKQWEVWTPQDGVALCEENGTQAARLLELGEVCEEKEISQPNQELTEPKWYWTGLVLGEQTAEEDRMPEERYIYENPVISDLQAQYFSACEGIVLSVQATPQIKHYSFQVRFMDSKGHVRLQAAYDVRTGRYRIMKAKNSSKINQERSAQDFLCHDACEGRREFGKMCQDAGIEI